MISDNPKAYALERARASGIEALWINPAAFPGREEYNRELIGQLKKDK